MQYRGYQKINGNFIYYRGDCDDSTVTTDNLWFLIGDADYMATLLSHGDKHLVEKRYKDMVEKYNNVFGKGNDTAKNLLLIDVTNVDIEEINACLDISGRVSKLVKSIK